MEGYYKMQFYSIIIIVQIFSNVALGNKSVELKELK